MKKHLFFLALVAALLLPTGLRAQETLTVADGTETTDQLPVYGYLIVSIYSPMRLSYSMIGYAAKEQ